MIKTPNLPSVFVMFVAITVTISTAGAGVALGADTKASSLTNQEKNSLAVYNATIHNSNHSLEVEITIPSEESLRLNFWGPLWNRDNGILQDVEILSNATKISNTTYEVHPEKGVVRFHYQLHIPIRNSVKGTDGIDDNIALLYAGDVFPAPHREGNTNLRINLHLPSQWSVYSPYNFSDNSLTLSEGEYRSAYDKLWDVGIMAGQPRFFKTTHAHGFTALNIYMPDTQRNISPPHPMHHLRAQFDLDPNKNANKYNQELLYYHKRWAEIYNSSPGYDKLISGASEMYRSGQGFWQSNSRRRHHHNARHLSSYLIDRSIRMPPPLTKSSNHFSDQLVYEYTSDERILGNPYLKFIIFERSHHRLNLTVKDPKHIPQYAYLPVMNWYLDYIIRNKSDGEHSLKDVMAHINNQANDRNIEAEEVPGVVKNGTGVDISEEYQRYILDNPEQLTDKYPAVRADSYQYFDDLLDHQRKFNSAPSTLFYSALEIAATNPHGSPGGVVTMLRSAPIISDYPLYFSDPGRTPINNFLVDLESNYPVDKSEFKSILNRYADSEDFFVYYSNRSQYDPNIKEVNYYLSGDFSNLVRKRAYVKKSHTYLSQTLPQDSNYTVQLNEIEDHYNNSTQLLVSDRFVESNSSIDKAITTVETLRTLDSDGDSLPDVMEYECGLDPSEKDTDEDGVPDSEEIKTIILDGYLEEWKNHRTENLSYEGDVINNASAIKQNDSIYLYAQLNKSYYNFNNFRLRFTTNISTWPHRPGVSRHTFPQQSDSVVQPGVVDHYAVENHTYIGSENIEFRIPIDNLKFYNESKSNFTIRTSVRGGNNHESVKFTFKNYSLVDVSESDDGGGGPGPAPIPGDKRVGEGYEYQSIQKAVDVTGDGDAVIVYPGTYNESVNIPGSITLRTPQNATEDVIIIPDGPGAAVTVQGNNTVIDGIEFWNESNDTDLSVKFVHAFDGKITNSTFSTEDIALSFYNNASSHTLYLNEISSHMTAYFFQANRSDNTWNSTTPRTYYFDGELFTQRMGNYYVDYNGKDTDGDGVGETPYQIGPNNTDYYPLIEKPDSYFLGDIPPIVGDNPPQDPDDDGKYEDVNGDGSVTIVDVQAFFMTFESDVVQNNVTSFDFNDDGEVSIVDVQALFNSLLH